MVAVVSGQGLGLLNTSAVNIGASGISGNTLMGGHANGSALVNIANGNLILQFTDESISGTGADLTQARSYNSQGLATDGDNDGWRWGGEKKVVLTGTLNALGSYVTRTTKIN